MEEITAEGVAELFIQRVFRYYRLPQRIISDRDPRFTSKFAKELCRLLGIKQNISTVKFSEENLVCDVHQCDICGFKWVSGKSLRTEQGS